MNVPIEHISISWFKLNIAERIAEKKNFIYKIN